jgi:hypothetical protein
VIEFWGIRLEDSDQKGVFLSMHWVRAGDCLTRGREIVWVDCERNWPGLFTARAIYGRPDGILQDKARRQAIKPRIQPEYLKVGGLSADLNSCV